MGVTKDSMVTTEGQRNWADACERETQRRYEWNENWGWMPSIIHDTNDRLKQLKEKQIARIRSTETGKKPSPKDYKPIPNTTNHEYGWLVSKPEFAIERFGPFPLAMKVQMQPTWDQVQEEITKQDHERLKRTKEKKKQEKMRRLMERTAEAAQEDKDEEINVTDSAKPSEEKSEQIQEGREEKREVVGENIELPVERKCGNTVLDSGGKKRLCCCTADCSCLKTDLKQLSHTN